MFVLVEPMLCIYFKNSDAYMLNFFLNTMKVVPRFLGKILLIKLQHIIFSLITE